MLDLCLNTEEALLVMLHDPNKAHYYNKQVLWVSEHGGGPASDAPQPEQGALL